MSRPKSPEAPPLDPIEKDFLEALTRLQQGEPTDRSLKAQQKKGTLKVTISSVALEAKRSRTLIGMDGCRYPRVRELILQAKSGESAEPRTYTDLVKRLRARIVDLGVQVKQYKEEAGIHFIARHEAEKATLQANNQVAKLLRKLEEAQKVVRLVPQKSKPLPRLMLIRGLPGSGKTTRALGYKKQGYKHLETDMFFQSGNEYVFDEVKLPDAHSWCLQQTLAALMGGERVVVANVFATLEDIKPYVDLGVPYEIVEANWKGKSIHNVSSRTQRATLKRWIPTEVLLEQLVGI